MDAGADSNTDCDTLADGDGYFDTCADRHSDSYAFVHGYANCHADRYGYAG